MAEIIKVSSYMSGPRWVPIQESLFQAATAYGIELKITEVDKGWLRKTVWFDLVGQPDDILKMTDALIEWARD